MSLTDRDRKVVLVLVPLMLVLGYWFLLLAPQREEASTAGAELTKQQDLRDQATAQLSQLESAKTTFAADYSEIVRLGKAIPSSVDMPSLLVQLDRAARGTGIKFTKVHAGPRQAAAPPTPPAAGGAPTPPSTPPGGTTSAPVAPGGAPAQSAPGKAGESAANTVGEANSKNEASGGGATVTPKDAQTSQQASGGKVPVGGAAGTPAAAGATPGVCAPGLECIPLDFEFDGRFFDLADFFHRLKRFVKMANDKVLVRGRLLTIDGLKFSSGEVFPSLKAEIKATVYLAPKAQGATAGATPQGPTTTPAAGSPAPAQPTPAPSPTPPTATATP